MTNPNQLISIIIPVFNESESIGYLLDEVLNVMRSNELHFEIVKPKLYKLLLIII